MRLIASDGGWRLGSCNFAVAEVSPYASVCPRAQRVTHALSGGECAVNHGRRLSVEHGCQSRPLSGSLNLATKFEGASRAGFRPLHVHSIEPLCHANRVRKVILSSRLLSMTVACSKSGVSVGSDRKVQSLFPAFAG